jgi:hypothetical protein
MSPEAAALVAARRVGLLAVQSSDGAGTPANRGGFRLIDARSGRVVAGRRFDLSPSAVAELCAARAPVAGVFLRGRRRLAA